MDDDGHNMMSRLTKKTNEDLLTAQYNQKSNGKEIYQLVCVDGAKITLLYLASMNITTNYLYACVI